MKKTITGFLLAILTISASSPIFAQNAGSNIAGKTAKFTSPDADESNTSFSKTEAYYDGNGVFIEWQMTLERGNAGFLVYRIDAAGKSQVTPDMVLGSAIRVSEAPTYGDRYSFYDEGGSIGAAYIIETIPMSGKRLSSEIFAAKYAADARISAENSLESDSRSAKILNSRLNSSKLSISDELNDEIQANSSVADPDTHRTVISQPGVKIGVRREGLYRVGRAELQAQGFNVSSDPSLWQLYVEGVQQSIIIGANGDYIEFYGKGIDRVESDTRLYYLIVGADAGKRMQSRVIRPSLGTAISPNYGQKAVRKERTSYIGDILNGEPENYWGRAVFTTPNPYAFNLSGIDFTRTESSIRLDFQGFTLGAHTVQIILNGNVLGMATGHAHNAFSKTFAIPTSFLIEGSNSLTMTATGGGDISFFDSASVEYARKYRSEQNRLSFVSPSLKIAKLEGFTSLNLRLFDVTYEGNPRILTNYNVVPTGMSFGVDLPAARSRLMFAVEDSAVLAAASITPNDPALLAVPTHNADLVIISYKTWLAQAETWADYRRGQGFTVKVVDIEEIYDEFNYGVLSADSIKGFLNYAASNWATPPRYVLLLGDASYDSRNYEGTGYFNLVPTRMVNTVYTETGSDEALADFDGDGLSEIAIGRISARNTQTVSNALGKVIAFEQPAMQSFDRGAIFAFDEPNGYDFEGMSNRLRSRLPDTMPVTMVNRLSQGSQATLINGINTGKYIVNYSGHGTTGAWHSTGFFWNGNVSQLTNANNQSIFTMLTCLNGYFLNLTFKSMAETLVDSTNGGAVAAWASTGLTTADIQELMATRFYQQLNAGNITRMGDLIKDAKTSIPGGGDVRLSWALIGDPMLKVRPDGSGGDRSQ
ncbi:MAG: hypothetical protein H7070_10870 [Saprospiraceae bacterium]|nr:hypothetical protein [Pyrinomonadaceae bacterium]